MNISILTFFYVDGNADKIQMRLWMKNKQRDSSIRHPCIVREISVLK